MGLHGFWRCFLVLLDDLLIHLRLHKQTKLLFLMMQLVSVNRKEGMHQQILVFSKYWFEQD